VKRTVTYSELKERRRCPWRAHLNYDRLLSPVIESPGLREGRIFDAGWNALYEQYKCDGRWDASTMCAAMIGEYTEQLGAIITRTTLMDEEHAAMQERLDELVCIAEHWVHTTSPDIYTEIVATQYEGHVPICAPSGRASTRYDLRFKLDGIVAIDGRLWIEERKAWKIIDQASLKMLQLDEQCGIYLWAVRQQIERREASPEVMRATEHYGPPVGVHYVVLRKKIPAIPPQLKDGSTSRDKRIDTTYDIYLRTLEERGQDPADYTEILESLLARGDTFSYRELVLRSDQELDEIGRRVWEAARFVAEGHTFKVPQRSCAWECPYFALCLEWSDEVAGMHFRTRERMHEEYEDVEEAV
jgi:hypothetical protein